MQLLYRIKDAARRLRDRRRASRLRTSGVVAYYWDGAIPRAHPLRDISRRGAYVFTEERWYIGTIVRFTIQTENAAEVLHAAGEKMFMTVPSRIVRHGPDGVGVEFVVLRRSDRHLINDFLNRMTPSAKPTSTGSSNNGRKGNALVEFALIIPLLFLLFVNTVNFGGLLYAWIEIANAARTGAQYASMAPAQLGSPNTPTAAAVATAVTNDTFSLLNKASIKVCVAKNHNGTITTSESVTGACTGVTTPADPEPALYDLVAVDVKYTYAPFVPLWEFPALRIHATLPATTIHRQGVMRVLQ